MLPELNVKIGADTVSLEKSLDRVEERMGGLKGISDKVGKGLQDFGGATQRLGRRMLPISGAVSGLAAALGATAVGAANAGNEIDKSSKAAGVSAETYQELGFAIGQVSDLTDKQLGSALESMTRRMGQAADGNENLQDAFAKIGISLEDIQSGAVTTEEAFMALTEAAGGMASDAEAASVAADLLGRSGASLGPILRESGDDIAGLRDRARELGIVMGDDAVGASADFVDKMDELRRQSGALRDRIGVALIPALMGFMGAIQDSVIPAMESMIDNVSQVIGWFGELPEGIQAAAGIIATALGVGGPVLMAVGAVMKILGSLAFLLSPAGLIVAGLVGLAAIWQKWGDDIMEFTGEAVDFVKEKFNALMEWFGELPGRFFEFGRNMVQGLLNGFNEMWENFKESIREKVDWIPDWIKRRMGIASPSKVFHEIGMNLGQGLANGINDSFGMVQSAVKGVGDMVTDSAFDMANGVVNAMGQMFQGSKPIAAAQALINTFQGITEALKLGPWGIPKAAAIAAQGFAAVRGITSARPGSSGGGSARAASSAGRGASSGGGGATQQAAAPRQQSNITLVGEFFTGEQVARVLNEYAQQGGQLSSDLVVRTA